ncbi:MAG: hypothetical protein QOI53_207 [Verrucomicrobiota bacterium]|nr:hypothetical protein [Verrucomicrobiota bacterium]
MTGRCARLKNAYFKVFRLKSGHYLCEVTYKSARIGHRSIWQSDSTQFNAVLPTEKDVKNVSARRNFRSFPTVVCSVTFTTK